MTRHRYIFVFETKSKIPFLAPLKLQLYSANYVIFEKLPENRKKKKSISLFAFEMVPNSKIYFCKKIVKQNFYLNYF